MSTLPEFRPLSPEAEVVLTRMKRQLVESHPDLVEGVKAIHRLGRAYDRNEPGSFVLLTGAAGTGKTTIMRQFIREEYARIEEDTGRPPRITPNGLHIPDGPEGDERSAIFVNAPSSRSTTALATQILRALGAEVPRNLHRHQVLDRLRVQLVGQKTRVLFIDEFHHLVSQNETVVWELSELVKDILVETKVQMVLSGMPVAARPVDANPQLDRRCRHRFPLVPFGWGADEADQKPLREFLVDLEAGMDLSEPWNLADPKLAGAIHASTGGIVGRVTRLLSIALEHSLEAGVGRIDGQWLGYAHDVLKPTGDRTNPFDQPKGPQQATRRHSRPNLPMRTRGSLTGKPSDPTYEKKARTA
ncbi:ATP-binding protein [Methylobacterium haplocladii]|uniref:AAA+ ATPase domain-containing protein n=1 Tax=Methylobacterium haplocladii TaxID=1176176 RepID=A0A512IUW9_9HYPH|nr:ATP-binding protein [Methylobacterium haplocladii]GEP01505.1 hypothetical protein MHA02_38920 [Methylobacterium haplocladii]GJD82310.1 hypothetical protein HPGCJGGD_0162 [Methylobacterium haplocladii]GLS59156.1 hypothetical protein GCM10007887_18220 [Methylobacterium haplocladii]